MTDPSSQEHRDRTVDLMACGLMLLTSDNPALAAAAENLLLTARMTDDEGFSQARETAKRVIDRSAEAEMLEDFICKLIQDARTTFMEFHRFSAEYKLIG